ncbi:cutinase transcription factor 1 beta [Fusarium tjaetaba]|uniref:Cutinase transcription factor 1 beta n=1 Tax=Fusarium tjaetaba TaxID=1567544 RepID=A0A8H5QY52_9HYPO|nr:cutinase transcription factor 1 beta [Fusarium tjaetaba]KAF5622703.1 cutinase transcription factor 1 beta [Fusarium tjaetaba]
MDQQSPSQRTRRTPNHGRKRGTACERCNRRRTKCDGSVIGVPCSACRKSGHQQCALIQSKRRRGPDGRYTLLPDIESRRSSGSPGFAPSNEDESMALTTEGSPTGGEHNSSSMQQLGDTTTTRPVSDQHASPSTQPSVVGESWYASYVMRGYTPGHNSVHRPIGECNETVQSVTRDARRESVCSRPSLPREKTTLSDFPSPDLVDRLIKVYFDKFHAFCPILGRKYFLTSLEDGTMSGTLLRSVLFVASLHCDPELLHLMGYSTRWEANNALYNKASAAFDEDRESSRTHMILSSYLLHYWFGSPTAYRDCHWWLAAAIRSAQCTGYHRSTRNSKMSPEERSKWKRIWWCLYVRDRQIAISTGTPMVINDEDHDVEELSEEDFTEEGPETVQYIVSQVKLSKAKVKPVLDAAAQIFSLVENSLLFWTPEHFPMIYVSALFSAMMALAVDVKTSAPESDQIFVKIRPGLLALKQFESVYILARWIKNFFMDILNRPPVEEAQTQPTNSNGGDVECGGTGTEMRSRSEDQVLDIDIQRNTAPANHAAHGATGFEDHNFAFDQSSGFEGGGFWPTYLANGVFSGVQSSDAIEFPHPDSFQYQAMYFLADLGIANTEPTD